MKNLIIYAHPYDKSYNSSILQQLENKFREAKQSVDVINLYKEEFNPVLKQEELALYSQGKFLDPMVQDYQNRINNADNLFFIFPVFFLPNTVFSRTLLMLTCTVGIAGTAQAQRDTEEFDEKICAFACARLLRCVVTRRSLLRRSRARGARRNPHQ